MAGSHVRLQIRLPAEAAGRFHSLCRERGVQPAVLLEDLVDNASQDRRSWSVVQSGYQTMLTLALVTALAKRTLTDDELAKVRHMGHQAGALLFGPLGKRPFDVEAPVPDDDRLVALFAALSE